MAQDYVKNFYILVNDLCVFEKNVYSAMWEFIL